MKTTPACLAIVSSLLFPLAVVAQSTFALQNFNSFAGVDAPVFDADGGLLAGADYAAELWGGATSSSLSPGRTISSEHQRVIVTFGTGNAAGYFQSSTSVGILDVAPGDYAWLQVRAWKTSLGSTYEDAALLGLGGYGESTPFYALGGDPGHLTPPQPLIGLDSFSLRPVVPEPGTWLLITIGLLGIVWRCRGMRAG